MREQEIHFKLIGRHFVFSNTMIQMIKSFVFVKKAA
jgi:hypothetical protein